MITDIRLRSQQLVNPAFNDPKELVAWMGALQGQEYSMAKWAVGLRLKKPDIRKVEAALEKGEILGLTCCARLGTWWWRRIFDGC